MGSDWSDVCEVIRKAHYQPLLLVYTNPFAEELDMTEVREGGRGGGREGGMEGGSGGGRERGREGGREGEGEGGREGEGEGEVEVGRDV